MDPGLKDLARKRVAGYCNVSPDRLGELSVQRMYDSDRRIYRLTPASGSLAFALKVRGDRAVKDDDHEDRASQFEYERLERAFAVAETAGPGIRMPIPLAFFPEYRAILTTWCDGSELRRIYYGNAWRWPLSAGPLRCCFERCGEWLGRFHNASRSSADAAPVAEERVGHVIRMIRQLAQSRRNLLATGELSWIERTIGDALTVSPKVETGLLHGNFTLRNLLISRDSIAPVDFEDSRNGAIDMDTGQMIADVMLSAYRPFIRAAARHGAIASFMKAYAVRTPVDPERIKGYAIYHVLAAYYEAVGRRSTGVPASALASYQARVFASLLRGPDRRIDACLKPRAEPASAATRS